MGELLREAELYYECVGLDPSGAALQEAERAGFSVIQGTLEEARLDDESFDVVTMNSVIEHVLDPLVMLKKTYRILKPDGVVALRTPKMWGPAYRMHGKEWKRIRPGYHTYLFDGKILAKTLEMAGFKVLASPKRDRMLDDVLILWGRKPAR